VLSLPSYSPSISIGAALDRNLPSDKEILPGVRWGSPSELFTPAYWAEIGSNASESVSFANPNGNLRREICFCLLGGFGIKAEINRAVFNRLSKNGIFKFGRELSTREIERLLRIPIRLGSRKIRYRFPRQRAKRIKNALKLIDNAIIPREDPLILRDWLLTIPGIGLKTASWIVRNHLGSDAVAILDVHIVRACQIMNVFREPINLPKDYKILEGQFLEFAKAIGVKPSLLDSIMWREMRTLNYFIHRLHPG